MQKKGALSSKTVWGGAIAALPALDALLVALKILPVPFLGDAAQILTSAIGGVLSIFGRFKAEKKISGLM